MTSTSTTHEDFLREAPDLATARRWYLKNPGHAKWFLDRLQHAVLAITYPLANSTLGRNEARRRILGHFALHTRNLVPDGVDDVLLAVYARTFEWIPTGRGRPATISPTARHASSSVKPAKGQILWRAYPDGVVPAEMSWEWCQRWLGWKLGALPPCEKLLPPRKTIRRLHEQNWRREKIPRVSLPDFADPRERGDVPNLPPYMPSIRPFCGKLPHLPPHAYRSVPMLATASTPNDPLSAPATRADVLELGFQIDALRALLTSERDESDLREISIQAE